MGETGLNLGRATSTTASLMRHAPRASAAQFTVPQRIARYGLTALAIVAMSTLFATQIAATLH